MVISNANLNFTYWQTLNLMCKFLQESMSSFQSHFLFFQMEPILKETNLKTRPHQLIMVSKNHPRNHEFVLCSSATYKNIIPLKVLKAIQIRINGIYLVSSYQMQHLKM